MRKSFVYAAGLMCLALSITDCQKELVDQTTPASEPNFELFAQPVTTKTANNGLDTKWVAEDGINVFHAEAGSTLYVSDNQFTVKDIETGRFDGTVSKSLSTDKSYDWYAFYPYKDKIVSPKNEKTGYCYIGSRSDATQSQTGDNNMLHISGGNYPLYGIAKNVASSDVPSIQMQHLSSVVKIVVTNSTDEALALTDVAFTANENISGQFYISFDSETPKYTDAQYSSKIAKLAVSDVTISPKASATVYFAVKPFTAKTGTTLKLAVNGYEKTLTLPTDVTFTAGHIKTLGFNVDKKIPKKVWTIVTDASTLAVGDKIVIVSNSKKKVAAGIESDYLKETSAQFSSDLSTIESMFADASVFTLGGSANSWTLSNSDGALLGATAAKKLAFNKGTTSWKIAISESNNATIQNGNSSYGKILHNVNSARFLTYTSATNVSMLLPQIYRLESALPALATPTVDYEIQNLNSIFVMWSQVEGAKDYTVTCGDKTVKVTGDKYTFEGLAYSTEYTISVVANPADASVNAPSAAGTATATTGANPAETVVETKIDFEAELTTYVDWSFTNIAKNNTITAKAGSYYGKTIERTSASAATKEIIAKPKNISFSISKETNNTKPSNWKVQVSTNNKDWTDVKSVSATDMSKGVWKDYSVDLASYKDVYVRIYYTGTTAIRCIDEVVLFYVK